MAQASEEGCANTWFAKHRVCWHIACQHSSAFGEGKPAFGDTLIKNRPEAGQDSSRGKAKATSTDDLIMQTHHEAFLWWRCGMQQPGVVRKCSRCSGSCERVEARGCNRAGKSSCTERPIWESGSAVLWLTGCLVRAGAHLSPFSKQLCGGVRLSLWGGCSSGVPAAPAFPPFCSGGFPRPPTSGWLPSGVPHCRHKPEVTNYS